MLNIAIAVGYRRKTKPEASAQEDSPPEHKLESLPNTDRKPSGNEGASTETLVIQDLDSAL